MIRDRSQADDLVSRLSRRSKRGDWRKRDSDGQVENGAFVLAGRHPR